MGSFKSSEVSELLATSHMLHEQAAAGELTWEGYLRALGKLVSAQLGTVARVSCSEPQRPRCTHSWGWSSAKHFRSVADYLVDPDAAPDPAGARTLNNVRFAKQGAMTRGELMSDSAWYATEHVQEFRKKSDLDACIYAVIEPRGDWMQGLTLHRAWGEKAFEPKDAQLVSLLIRATAALRRSIDTEACALSPRLRQTLQLLAAGCSEKEISAELTLSRHTVHDYVKKLHKTFRVQNRVDLLRRARCAGALSSNPSWSPLTCADDPPNQRRIRRA